MEVAQRSPASDEEAGLAVAQSFVHLGQGERDLAHSIEFTLSHVNESRIDA
jgi:hypothetical protein